MTDRMTDRPTDPLIDVRRLSVSFKTRRGPVQVVRDVSFSLARGETMVLLGESGSGKTVTAQSMMGLLGRSATVTGEVRFDGANLLDLSFKGWTRYRGPRIAMVFQDALTALNPVHTVGAQIAEVIRAHTPTARVDARQQAVEMMQRVGIPAAESRYGQYPHQFSGGMRQRVMIAVALALQPEILIADEPTTALDVTVQAQIMRLLARLREETGMALLLVTHDLGVAADVADHIAVMYAGRIVESGPTEAIYTASRHPYTRALLRSAPRLSQRVGRLVPVSGTPPAMDRLPSGCAFRPRCPLAAPQCRTDVPELRDVSSGLRSACHRVEELVP